MFKLMVVSGPEKGRAYSINEIGDTSIGRADSNDIILESKKVSKQHCVLVVDNGKVGVKDCGSSNGTFVNGVLSKEKHVRTGDRISVGEYVLEVVNVERRRAPALANAQPHLVSVPLANHAPQGSQMPMASGGMNPMGALPGLGGTGLHQAAGLGGEAPKKDTPQSLKERIQFIFENYILNFAYNLNEKHEWRTLMAGMFVILVVFGSIGGVYPLVEATKEKLTQEAAGRALVLARQMVDRNSTHIFEKNESKLDVSYIEREPGVRAAYITDMEGRVLAPSRLLNQYLTEPTEAAFSASARVKFNELESLERRAQIIGDTAAVAVPLKIFSPTVSKNVTVAIGYVFYDKTLVTVDSGTEMLNYIQSMIVAAIFAVIVYFTLYRLTIRPIETLNHEIDQVLKGNGMAVSNKFKMEEIEPLIDVVNAALQRIPSSASGGLQDQEMSESTIDSIKRIGDVLMGVGFIVFGSDRKILSWNNTMEEITGIRSDGAIGNEIANVARDAAFGSFMDDLFLRSQSGEQIVDDFEFSGSAYRMQCTPILQGASVKIFVVAAQKVE